MHIRARAQISNDQNPKKSKMEEECVRVCARAQKIRSLSLKFVIAHRTAQPNTFSYFHVSLFSFSFCSMYGNGTPCNYIKSSHLGLGSGFGSGTHFRDLHLALRSQLHLVESMVLVLAGQKR